MNEPYDNILTRNLITLQRIINEIDRTFLNLPRDLDNGSTSSCAIALGKLDGLFLSANEVVKVMELDFTQEVANREYNRNKNE